jgi:hypothetical protein
MIGRVLLGLVLSVAASAVSAQAIVVEGVKFEPTSTVGGQEVVLNGAGLRSRLFIKVYAAGVYVPQKSNDPAVLLAQNGPRRILIGMLRDVDAQTFANSLLEGLAANHSEKQMADFKPQIDQLLTAMRTVGEAKKSDVIQLDYTSDAGTRMFVNGRPLGEPVAGGAAFFNALLRIWIGDKPVDTSLKKAMLGG